MVNAIETRIFENDGTMVELYMMNNGKPAVRMSDIEMPNEYIGITVYPTMERAKVGFDKLVAKCIAHGAI